MRVVLAYSVRLVVGLGLSQVLPVLLGEARDAVATTIRLLTMTGLAFIMIRVGFEFHIDKSNPRQYGWDYVVAFTAAQFPLVLVTGYFVIVMLPPERWADLDTVSPLTRGWTQDTDNAAQQSQGFPAHAVMDPRARPSAPSSRRFPRSRGVVRRHVL